ncbi:TM2 domain-containing protein [Sphingomonas sp. BK235]|jgi:TM2 domain-containing membrane protein YozV|uniref:TM2 domain-containing protein n=1 Tax=Sphingomonas sp. BK235 TaxID=2512131 RepID=UPI00104968FE|nr:TM2 domain-containing protein [Sphingomonas sp. BK235]TCP33662.1 TM2 domain-containing membrane protein YozV [Sphingomonas sp. BK235]
MRGQILGMDVRSGEGVVAGEDGQRYTFTPQDWAQHGEPSHGQMVDFEAAGSHARNVFPVPAPAGTPPARVAAVPVPAPVSDRNKYVAAALAFLFGVFGIHRFYLGRVTSGIVMTVLTFTLIGLLVTLPLSLIDMVRYLMMSDREFAARYPRG